MEKHESKPFLRKLVRQRLRRDGNFWRRARRVLVLATLMGVIMFCFAFNTEVTYGPQRYMKSVAGSVTNAITNVDDDSPYLSQTVSSEVVAQMRARGYTVDTQQYLPGKVNGKDAYWTVYQPGGILTPQLKSGRQVANDNEVVLDRILASEVGVHVGSTVHMSGLPFTVVGLSTNTNSYGKLLTFVNQAAYTNLAQTDKREFVAVKLRPGQQWPPAGICTQRCRFWTWQGYIKSDRAYQARNFSGAIELVVVLVALIGFSFVASRLSLEIEHQRPNYNRMYAAAQGGFLPTVLARIERRVQLVYFAVALPVALGIAWLITGVTLLFSGRIHWIPAVFPGVSTSVSVGDFVATALICLLLVLVCSWLPLRRLGKDSVTDALRSASADA